MPLGRPVGLQKRDFTADEDAFLCKYLATYNPAREGRLGNAIYKQLEANSEKLWNWSRTHPWQSWRNRYKSNQQQFDSKISRYQRKHDIDPNGPPKAIKRRISPAANDAISSIGSVAGASTHGKRPREPANDGPQPHKRPRPNPPALAGPPGSSAERHRGRTGSQEDEGEEEEADKDADDVVNVVGPDDYSHGIFDSNSAGEYVEEENDAEQSKARDDDDEHVPAVDELSQGSKVSQNPTAWVISQEPLTPPQTTPPGSRASPTPSPESITLSLSKGSTKDSRETQVASRLEIPADSPAAQKLVLKRRSPLDDDIFRATSAPSTPTQKSESVTSITLDRQPPRYDIGPYTSAFSNHLSKTSLSPSGHRRTGVGALSANKEIVWPPKRSDFTANVPGNSAASERSAFRTTKPPSPPPDLAVERARNPSSPPSPPIPTQAAQPPSSARPPARENAAASSSRVQLPSKTLRPEHYSHVSPSNLKKIFSHTASAPLPKLPSLTVSLLGRRSPSEELQPAHYSSDTRISAVASRTISPLSDTDPFLDSSPLPSILKGKHRAIPIRRVRRQTFGGFGGGRVSPSTVRKTSATSTNFHNRKHHSRRSVPALSTTTRDRSSSVLLRSSVEADSEFLIASGNSSQRLSTADESHLVNLGWQTFIKKAAEEYGFQERVVQSVLEQEKSLARATKVLQLMQAAALRQFNDYDDPQESEGAGGEKEEEEENSWTDEEESSADDAEPGAQLTRPVTSLSYYPLRDPRLRRNPRVSRSGLRYVAAQAPSPPPQPHARFSSNLSKSRRLEVQQLMSSRSSSRNALRTEAAVSPSPRRAKNSSPIGLSRSSTPPSAAKVVDLRTLSSAPVARVLDTIVHGGVTMLRADSGRRTGSKDLKSGSEDLHEVEHLLTAHSPNMDIHLDAGDGVEPKEGAILGSIAGASISVSGNPDIGVVTNKKSAGPRASTDIHANEPTASDLTGEYSLREQVSQPKAKAVNEDATSSNFPPAVSFPLSRIRADAFPSNSNKWLNEEEESRIRQALLAGDYHSLCEAQEKYGSLQMAVWVQDWALNTWDARHSKD